MDSNGDHRPRSISEEWGERVNRAAVLRMLWGAWLVPAASLVWMGFASTGLREVDGPSLSLALGRIQALALLLTIFTVLAAVPAWLRCEGATSGRGSVPAANLLGLAVALPAGLAGAGSSPLAPVLFPVAALAGFWAALAVPRWLLGLDNPKTAPLAALTLGVAFQLTVGWLHLAHPAGVASPALVVEGLILAWAATAAARVDPFPSTSTATSTSTAAPSFSQAPAPRSLPEAAVGR